MNRGRRIRREGRVTDRRERMDGETRHVTLSPFEIVPTFTWH